MVNNDVYVPGHLLKSLFSKRIWWHYKPYPHAFGRHFHPVSLILSLRARSLGIELLTLALQSPFQLRALNCWHEQASLRVYTRLRYLKQCPAYEAFLSTASLETVASSGVLGAISPMPLSSLAVTAKSVLQNRGARKPAWKQTHKADRTAQRPTEGRLSLQHIEQEARCIEPRGTVARLSGNV